MKQITKIPVMLDFIILPFRMIPLWSFLTVLLYLLSGILPTVNAIAIASFIEAVMRFFSGTDTTMSWGMPLVWICINAMFSIILEPCLTVTGKRVNIGLQRTLQQDIIKKCASLEYRQIEDMQMQDMISRVTNKPEEYIRKGFTNTLSLCALAIRVVGLLGMLFFVVWWAAFLVLAVSIPMIALAMRSGRANYTAEQETTRMERVSEYLSSVLLSREAAEERSLFQYSSELNKKYWENYQEVWRYRLRVSAKWAAKNEAAGIFAAAASLAVLFIMMMATLNGGMELGMFISLSSSFTQLIRLIGRRLIRLIDQQAVCHAFLLELRSFWEMDSKEAYLLPPSEKVPEFKSLEFRNVSFRYPNTEQEVLKDCSFLLEAGKHYAFVGKNGSGKTTIIRLMTGLFTDYEGQILLNGKPMESYDIPTRKAMFAIEYQDFAKYQITARDNISIGDMSGLGNQTIDNRMEDIVRKAGLTSVISRLPKGLDTSLGKMKEGGCDISGGEWQRIALARTLMGNAPVLILDEPTAAIDPLEESEIYMKFKEVSVGRTTIMLTHRLGSVRSMDAILLLGDGKVVCQGSHEEMLAGSDEYAAMYNSQKGWYE